MADQQSNAAETGAAPRGVDGGDDHWLVRPRTVFWLKTIAIVVLALLVLLEFVIHLHPHFEIDAAFGFAAWYGFLTCVAMVFFAKGLGLLLKRPDSYYDEPSEEDAGGPRGGA